MTIHLYMCSNIWTVSKCHSIWLPHLPLALHETGEVVPQILEDSKLVHFSVGILSDVKIPGTLMLL